jgi:protein-disulfide isomerase-like protein with CxxC motif
MSVLVRIAHFTDPSCPFAFSAEPRMRRMEWQLGDRVTWRTRMVGLVSHPDEAAARGFTPARLTASHADFAARYGMPISTTPLTRLYSTTPACRAIVATRLFAPEKERLLLRAFRVRHFGGHLLDGPETLAMAAADAHLPLDDLQAAIDDPISGELLAADMAASRTPTAAALAQPARLAGPDGERRYTCPSLEFAHANGTMMSAPGFQPDESYDLALANLDPSLARRAPATDVAQVLEWAPFALATVEVAAVCAIDPNQAAAELHAVATETIVGTGSYWTLAR